jgi:hypothetical protein
MTIVRRVAATDDQQDRLTVSKLTCRKAKSSTLLPFVGPALVVSVQSIAEAIR